MNGPTHATIGVAAGAGIAFLMGVDQGEAMMMVVAALTTCKLPDADLNLGIAHRGLTHSLIALAAVYVGSFLFFPSFIAWALVGGYASHIAADMITNRGVMLLYPLPYRLGLGLMSTGSFRESMFRLMVMGLILLIGREWFI